jgi:hypothetical protein
MEIYCHVLRMGSVTNNATRVGLDTGFIRYVDYNFKQLLHITITVNTIALAAPWIPLIELYRAEVSLRGLSTSDSATN